MKPMVLIVEDEAPLVTLLKYNLEKEGFAVCSAGDGEEALLQIAENKPDAPDWLVQTLRDWDSALTWTGLAELHSVVRHSVEKARAVTFQPSP